MSDSLVKLYLNMADHLCCSKCRSASIILIISVELIRKV